MSYLGFIAPINNWVISSRGTRLTVSPGRLEKRIFDIGTTRLIYSSVLFTRLPPHLSVHVYFVEIYLVYDCYSTKDFYPYNFGSLTPGCFILTLLYFLFKPLSHFESVLRHSSSAYFLKNSTCVKGVAVCRIK